MDIHCKTLADMDHFAGFLAKQLRPGDIVLLDGDLGAGKTTLVRLLCTYLGYSGVTSPTFILIQKYPTRPTVMHLDLYRLQSETDIAFLDLGSVLDDDLSIIFIEWSEKLGQMCPKDYLRLAIKAGVGEERTLTVSGSLHVYLESYAR